MGSRRFSDLVGMRRPGHSHAIGKSLRRRRSTATESFLNSAFEVEFGEEIEIEDEFGWRRLPPEAGDGDPRVWVGFEIQTRDKSLQDATLVVASYPYSTDWFDWSDFKPILRRGREERFQPLRAPQERVKALFRDRSELPTENLDTRPDLLTARLSLPTRTPGLAITARGRSPEQKIWKATEASLNRKRGGKYQRDYWCFGACRDFEKCCEVLRMSPQAQRLLEQTCDGSLFKDRPLANMRGQQTAKMRPLQIGPTAKNLKDDVLESSIIKALAGSSPKLEKIQALGKPPLPALLMEWIYTETMYSLAQRLRGEPDAGRRVYPKDLNALAAPTKPPADSSEKEQIKTFRDALRNHGLTQEFRNLIASWLRGRDSEKQITACTALEGAVEAGYWPQPAFDSLLQRLVTDPATSAAVRQAAGRVLDLIRSARPPAE